MACRQTLQIATPRRSEPTASQASAAPNNVFSALGSGTLGNQAVTEIGAQAAATVTGRRVVVLHVFMKKSRRTPRRALATARERMRQVKI